MHYVSARRLDVRVCTEVGIRKAAVFQHLGIFRRGPYFGAGELLDLGHGGGVIPVGQHGEQDADIVKIIVEIKTQGFDVVADHGRGVGQDGIDEDVAFVGGSEKYAQIQGTDAIERADDAEGRERRDSAFRGIGLGVDSATEEDQCAGHGGQVTAD